MDNILFSVPWLYLLLFIYLIFLGALLKGSSPITSQSRLASAPTHLNNINNSSSASSTGPTSLAPTLELMHKDNQTIFTLNSTGNSQTSGNSNFNSNSNQNNSTSSSSPPVGDVANGPQFKSIENRRSKLLETLSVKSPAGGGGQEARSRSSVSSIPDSPVSEGQSLPGSNRHSALKGAKPVFPKPKPKPLGKKPNQHNNKPQQSPASNRGSGEKLSYP